MEETKRKLPSFPPNYVTLVQLQERWMQRQQQKQKQNENEYEQQQQQQTEETGVAVPVCITSCESESTEKMKNSRKRKYRRRRRRKGKEWRKTRAEDHEVNGGGGGGESHAPEHASVEDVDVVVADPTVEIEGKFEGMSIDGGNEKFVNRSKNGSNRLRDREGRKTNTARRMVWVKKGDWQVLVLITSLPSKMHNLI